MYNNQQRYDMSDLERELELEMDDHESGGDLEFEVGDDSEFEAMDDLELESDEESGDVERGGYAERLAALGAREFENEFEFDNAVNQVLGEMEQEFFWGGGLLKKLRNSRLGRAAMGGVKGFLKGKFGNIPGLSALMALRALTKLPRDGLRGALSNFAKAALPTVLAGIPGGAVALPALKALGFNESADPDDNHEVWDNFVGATREAYDHLARNLNERADEPLEASRLAGAAFQHGLKKLQASRGSGASGSERTRTIRLRRGDRLRIIVD